MIDLIPVSRTDKRYKEIRDRHYVENHGCIGRQLHYLVEVDGSIFGIISGASAVWACEPRDNYFDINKDNRKERINLIIDNVVFRLEKTYPNLATQVLSKWRKQVVTDWQERYDSIVIGFETFVFGGERTGALYKADNWNLVGKTKGSAKYKPHGAYNKGERRVVPSKLVFVKKMYTPKN